MLDKNELLSIVMALVQVPERDTELDDIRHRFIKRERPWSDADAKTEYRLNHASKIIKVANGSLA